MSGECEQNTPARYNSDPVPSSKRVLSSPLSPDDYLIKKTKLNLNMASAESLMEDIEFEGREQQSADPTEGLSQSLTISDNHLKKIAEYIQPAVHYDVLSQIRNDLRSIVKDAVNEAIDRKLSELNSETLRLQLENDELKERVTKLEKAADEAEQYSRRNCLRITQIPETADEVTDEIVLKVADSIDVKLSPSEIDRSHRVGKPGTKQRRDIIVKLSTYRARERLFKSRSKLKDSEFRGVYINEDLTKMRGELLYEARKCVKAGKLKGAWSTDGRILVKNTADKIIRIMSLEQLQNLCNIQHEPTGLQTAVKTT